MSPKPAADEPHPDPLESRLRKLQPVSCGNIDATEADLLYRCGWEAALTSRGTAAVQQRLSWSSFCGGAVAGLAATLLCTAWLGAGLNRGQDQPPVVAQQAIRETTAPPDSQRIDQVAPAALVQDQAAATDAAELFANVFPWPRQFSQPSTATFVAVNRPQDPLSPAASLNWESVLVGPAVANGNEGGDGRGVKSLGEMLWNVTEPNQLF